MPLETGNMGGVGDFVAALTGRKAIRQQAEADAWSQASNIGRAKKAAAEARIAEDELTQRGSLAEALTALGADPNLSAVMRGGFANFPQAVQGQGGLFDLAQTRQAAQMAMQANPDTAMMNRVLAARLSGGGPLSPQQTDPEGLAAALIGTEQAQAANYRASADASGRRAAAYEYDVQSRAADRANEPKAPATLAGSTLQLFQKPVFDPVSGKTVMQLDQDAMNRFFADRASLGGTNDINQDAYAWIASQQPTQPIFIDPTRPESMTRSPPVPMRAPPAGAVQMLRANPGLASEFDRKYGSGAASRVLGGN